MHAAMMCRSALVADASVEQENRRHRRLVKKASKLDAKDLLEIAGMKGVREPAASILHPSSSASSSSGGASSSSHGMHTPVLAASGEHMLRASHEDGDEVTGGERLGPTSHDDAGMHDDEHSVAVAEHSHHGGEEAMDT